MCLFTSQSSVWLWFDWCRGHGGGSQEVEKRSCSAHVHQELRAPNPVRRETSSQLTFTPYTLHYCHITSEKEFTKHIVSVLTDTVSTADVAHPVWTKGQIIMGSNAFLSRVASRRVQCRHRLTHRQVISEEYIIS